MTGPVSWDEQVDAYLTSLLSDDRTAALVQVHELAAAGHDLLDLIQHLLAPAQLRVGQLWVADVWTVAQEHAATAITESVVTTLAAEREARTARAPDAPRVVVSCVEQEWHALPALMVAEHLRADGFAVTYLGPNSSVQALVREVHEVGPVAVLLSCSLSAFLALARKQVEAVRETGTPVVVGGSAFDPGGDRARVIGATAFAVGAGGIGDLVRRLPTAVPPAAPLEHPGAEEAYAVFGDRERLADDTGRLLRAALVVDPDVRWLAVLDDQLPHLVGSIAGALVTDDPGVVAHALAWTDVVLRHRAAPAGTAPVLAHALAEALHGHPEASRMLATAGAL